MDGQVQAGSRRFAAMAGAFFLGVFNDNFYKQAVLVLAVAAGRTELQGLAVAVFTLPYLVFAAPAGWAADRFPKGRVVVAAKAAEVAAMVAGALGIAFGHWGLTLAMLATMGTQAAFMSPAVNGSIPELFPDEKVPWANGVLRMVVTVGILAGIALAGLALDRPGTGPWGVENGRLWVAAAVLAVAAAGLGVALLAGPGDAADPRAPFPWRGPADTLRDLAEAGRDPLLAATLCASVFIWSSGSLQVLLINPMGLAEMGLSKSMTSGLIVAQLMGIAAGGILSPRLSRGPRWHRVLAPYGAGMGLAMVLVPALRVLPPGAALPGAFLLMAAIGFFGGVVLIPVESFIQTRPEPARRGAVLAAANFAVFAGILLSGPLSNLLNDHLRPTTAMGLVGVLAAGISLVLGAAARRADPV
ncbi:MAG TPA: MFS transporter [Holophaga sp.]|nr:MFS transporter [Holophaga sp.]